MKSFSSSVINKSGKKFAPKAPVRRAPPAPSTTPAPPRRHSTASQTSTTQNAQPALDKAPAEPAPPATVPEPSVPSAADVQLPVAESSRAPRPDSIPSKSVTAIPIPVSKRKASFSAPTRRVTVEEAPAPSQSLAHHDTNTERSPTNLEANGPEKQREIVQSIEVPQNLVSRDDASTPVASSQNLPPVETATEIRPSKRLKLTQESSTTSTRPTLSPSHVITPPSTQPPTVEETTEVTDGVESQANADQSRRASKSRVRRASRISNVEDAAGKVTRKQQRSRKKREPTPEGADLIEIAPAVVKMSELCKDLRTGKMSRRETELRNMELAEQERKRAQQEDESQTPVPLKPNADVASPAAEPDIAVDKKPQAGPVMRIVNGEIVLDAASLQVDRYADAARNAGELEDVVESSLTRKINQATWGKRSKTESWDEEMTDLFYRGLRMFGTDFMMISKLFPGRSRRQIKLKFNNEERRAPERIKETLLGPRETIDITTYSEMTNTVYDDPRVVQQELDEEKKRIEEQHAKEKQAQEDLLRNPDGTTDGGTAPGLDNANNVPVKGKRNNKRQAMKAMGGGTEEVIGTIDDFP
ncbi:transcription factor TFIIIB component B [Aspergillus pseudoviridinutans]|uniref:Transcription factor TFIIIB component B n=1 Tax=Aspergillus pseudoviridinutans TaxID=1517512 RepID=A0A9P3BKE0_9EURO|nr:transcription factor TFIIIB component B [Aspergillus pseudoviridinutans]GIJ89958.1 transcription factor TFIIIB component B [Aspergillus pseudoviridinutans]